MPTIFLEPKMVLIKDFRTFKFLFVIKKLDYRCHIFHEGSFKALKARALLKNSRKETKVKFFKDKGLIKFHYNRKCPFLLFSAKKEINKFIWTLPI